MMICEMLGPKHWLRTRLVSSLFDDVSINMSKIWRSNARSHYNTLLEEQKEIMTDQDALISQIEVNLVRNFDDVIT